MLNKNHLIVSILTIITNVCFPISQDKLELFKPENVQRFADYLFNEKDYERAANEYERFLYLSGEENDSTLFKIGICHQLLDQNEFALNVFKRIRNNNQYTSLDSLTRLAKFYSNLKLERWSAITETKHVNSIDYYFLYYAKTVGFNIPIDEEFFKKIKDINLRNDLRDIEEMRQKIRYKSPMISGILSLLFPGLGKIYNGRAGDGLFSLAAISFTGFASYMAFKEEREVTGLITGAMSISFYMGNIYGSFIGAKSQNRKNLEDWEIKLNDLNPVKKEPYWDRFR